MGIEKKTDGVWVPDKQTQWPQMSDPERSKVYESHKEKYAGTMAKYKNEREKEQDDYWYEISNAFDYTSEYAATDPKLKGMPVSMALLLAFRKEFNLDDSENGLKGKEKSMMLYSLNYLQNAEVNKALRQAQYPKGNIDTVPKDGFVKIVKEDWRWKLKILDKDKKVLFAGFMFPPHK